LHFNLIPKAKGDIKFIDSASEDAFFNFVEQDSYLKANKGKYAEANAALSPWVNSFDLRLLREYYFKVGGRTNTLQFSMDFINVGNMLNSEWGVEKTTISLVGVKFLKYEGKMLTMFLLTHLKLVVNTQLVHTIITQTLIKPGDFK
jgi:hypothetical protein